MVTPLPGEQGPSVPLIPDDIYDFLSSHQRGRFRPVAIGSSETIHVEPLSGAHVSSVASSESSVFDPVKSSSSMSSVSLGEPLPCEFFGYDDCEEIFDRNNVDGWVHHIVSQHLHGILPMECICWFCDGTVFRAQDGTTQERQRNFTARMRHIAGHFFQGATAEGMRADFFFLDHLRNNGLISERAYGIARDWHEAPQPRGGINTKRPSSSAYQRARVVVEVKSRRGRYGERRRQFHQQTNGIVP